MKFEPGNNTMDSSMLRAWDEGDDLQDNTAIKYDEGKPRLDLIPGEALLPIGEVLAYGAEKYDKVNKAYNWRHGMAWSRPLAAALRHIVKWSMGQRYDNESSRSHLAHAIVSLMFLLTYEETGAGVDDRWKGKEK